MLCTFFRSTLSKTAGSSLNTLRIQPRQSATLSISPFRKYATSRAPPVPRIPPTTRPPPRAPLRANAPSPARQTSARPTTSVLTSMSQSRRIDLAEKLFKAGDTTLYQSLGRTTFFRVNSYALTLLCALGITYYYTTGYLDPKTYKAMEHDYPVLVLGAFTVASVLMGALGGWVFKKSWNHIHSINLVRKASGVAIQVTYRSAMPFVKRSFIIQPQNIIVDARFISATGLPDALVPSAPSESSPSAFTAGVLRESLKSISRFFYFIFDGARIFFSGEGIIKVNIEQEKRGKMKKTEYLLDAGALYLTENDHIVLWDLIETDDMYGIL